MRSAMYRPVLAQASSRSVNNFFVSQYPNCGRNHYFTEPRNMAPNQSSMAVEKEIFPQQSKVIDYNRFVNDFEGRREPSLVRELNKLHSQKTSDIITLAGGLPNSATFPFESINLRMRDGREILLSGKELNESLQYMPTQGYPPLLEYLRYFQNRVHRVPNWENYDILVTPGSQDGLSKAIEMTLEKGEPIILQHPVYSGIECVVKPFEADIIAVEQDQDGLRPDALLKALRQRMTPQDGFVKKSGVPKLMYVNTTGANPTGVELSLERKREIYSIASEYNLIILEDDPYYYLHFQEEYPTSFLSMDTEGRVLRFDSFSKIVSPGLRVGFVTGPKQLIRRMELHLQASSLHASSFSQVMIYRTLKTWGYAGFFERASEVQKFYKERRNAMIKAAKKYLTGLAEWHEPTAGMFIWLRIPDLEDVRSLVMDECMRRGVILVTGHAYIVHANAPCQYLRACYSIANLQEIDEGIKRLADAIRCEIRKNANKFDVYGKNRAYQPMLDIQEVSNELPIDLGDQNLGQPLRGLREPLGT